MSTPMSAASPLPRLRAYPLWEAQILQWEWVGLSDQDQILLRGTTQDLPPHHRLEVVLPGEWLAPHRLTIPVTNQRYLHTIIKQTLEDRLLSKLDDSLIAIGARQEKTQWVWVCDKTRVDALLSSLQRAGLTPAQVYPIFELLPQASMARTPTGYIFHSASGDYGFVEDLTQLTQVFPDLPPACDDFLASPCHPQSNFLHGRVTKKGSIFNILVFRRAALLMGLVAGAFLLSLALRWQSLSHRESLLQQEIRQIFAATFPGTPIVDPALQWHSLRPSPYHQTTTDALDSLQKLATDLGKPIHPQQIEVSPSAIRLTLSESEFNLIQPLFEEKKIRFDLSRTKKDGFVVINMSHHTSQPNRKAE